MEKEIKDELLTILTTFEQLGKAHTSGYIVRILQGDTQYAYKQETHKKLLTFGMMARVSFRRIGNIIQLAVKEDYLSVIDRKHGLLLLTEKGKAFIKSPQSTVVRSDLIRTPWYDYYLERKLRAIRKDYAKKVKIPVYRVFNNYIMDQIVEMKPQSEADLRYLPGMLGVADELVSIILEAVKDVLKKKGKKELLWVYERAFKPSHFKVKDLYDQGLNVLDIAKKRNIRPQTVQRYLTDLHLAGEIDFKVWIEENVDEESLFKGVEYFKQVKNPRLREAHDVLGIDYEILRMCRAYALKVEAPPLRYAS